VMEMTTTAFKIYVMNRITGHTQHVNTAQRLMELTVYQGVLLTATAPLTSPCVVSLVMATGAAVTTTTTALLSVLTTSATPTPTAVLRI